MTCEDHHTGMQYVQTKPGKEPEMKSWCFDCHRTPTKASVVEPSTETKPPAVAAAKRTPRSKNGVRSS